MESVFIDNSHKGRYLNLIKSAGIYEYDRERQSLMYIISGNNDLYLKKDSIYDFYENVILSDCVISSKVDFCSSSRALIRLAFNLFNGYTDDYTNPLTLLCGLDSRNLLLAYQAILMRLQDQNCHLALACHGG